MRYLRHTYNQFHQRFDLMTSYDINAIILKRILLSTKYFISQQHISKITVELQLMFKSSQINLIKLN
jgi:hypothetical protein